MDDRMKDLLISTVEWATREAARGKNGQWYQEDVFLTEDERVEMLGHEVGCGSSYCIAGKMVSDHYGVKSPYKVKAPEMWGGAMAHAQEMLGLTQQQADYLFGPTRTIEEIQDFVGELVGEPGREWGRK